jgi:hypothetical protein
MLEPLRVYCVQWIFGIGWHNLPMAFVTAEDALVASTKTTRPYAAAG